MGSIGGWVVADAEIIHRIVDEARLEVGLFAEKAAGGHNLLYDELRLIGGEGEAFFFLELVHDGGEDILGQGHSVALALLFEDAPISIQRGGTYLDLVREAAEERRVHQLFRLEIGGEDHHLLEGNAEAFAGMQLEVIDAALEGHDPAIEKVGGT